MTIAPSNKTSVDNKLEEWLEQLKADGDLTLSYLLSKLKELWYKSSLQLLGDWYIVDDRLLLSLPRRRELIYFTINLELKEIAIAMFSVTINTKKLKETEETIITTIVGFLQQYLESNLNEKI